MKEQSFNSHTRWVPLYHFYLTGFLFLTLIGSVVNLFGSLRAGVGVYSASLILALALSLIVVGFFARSFALAAQDRAIRAEENFRHYLLFQKPLDSQLTMRQIIGLRFAADEEFGALAKRAVDEKLSEMQIKEAVKNWRPDYHRA